MLALILALSVGQISDSRSDVPLLHTAGVIVLTRTAEAVARSDWGALNPQHLRAPRLDRGPLLTSDGSSLVRNTLGHGALGSEFYLSWRRCGHGPLASALGAAGATVVWEYGVQAWQARPSAIDLVWTPVVGALVGEARWQVMRAFPVLSPVVDPLGALERALGSEC